MNITDSSQERAPFILTTDKSGKILEVVRKEEGYGLNINVGDYIVELFDDLSTQKFFNFMMEINTKGFTLGWRLNLKILKEVFLSGVTDNNTFLIILSFSYNTMLKELMKMDSQETDKPETTLFSNKVKQIVLPEIKDNTLYDEISRLNNELVNIHRDMAKKNAELEKLNELKNQFLGMAAHDIRKPITIIMYAGDSLVNEASDRLTEEHLEYLKYINNAAGSMEQIVNDFLDISIIESGKLYLNIEEVELQRLIKNSITLNTPLALKKKVTVINEHNSDAPRFFADGPKIEQVITNFLSNAIEHTKSDTIVRIETMLKEETVTLSVKDEGPGIPQEELTMLFKPFERTSIKKNNGEKSIGLGLTIARKIIEAHNGKIWVESTVGEGSIFSFSLALNPEYEI